jgi:hypothetical protein
MCWDGQNLRAKMGLNLKYNHVCNQKGLKQSKGLKAIKRA